MNDKGINSSNGNRNVGGGSEIRTGNGIGKNPPPSSVKPGIPGPGGK